MSGKFPEYKELKLSEITQEILKFWKENDTFRKSLKIRENNKPFVFYEGPPSANGMPGIHHTLSRTLKDTFCRYKTMQGYYVERKAGWDTHGLPVEIQVEKKLGIRKDDIGKKISVEEYNKVCRSEVMKYTDKFEELTELMGYWIDMDDPYITYDSKYIETLWWLLKQLYEKGLLYKGYTIQPYSPAAGTGLSSHELNQPGCYRPVKDTTATVLFKVVRDEKSEFLFKDTDTDIYFLAWTTTPWTLLSNTALAVGENIVYQKIKTLNPYTGEPITIILAKDRVPYFFNEEMKDVDFEEYKFKPGDKNIPYKVLGEYKGKDFLYIRYEQLLPYKQPEDGDAFKVITGDFVSTEEGTGIVHIAPSFGADDFNVAKQHGIGSLTLVDKQGKFVDGVGEFSGRFVRKEYKEDEGDVNVDIVVKLKKEGKLFRSEKYEHSYPHCWRTDKPIIYYPLDSWFIKTTAFKDRMIELNKTINWQPPYTGEGRFGEWLANLVDWNLSRSRFWGTPLPIWRTEDGKEEKCIGSFAELKEEIEKSVKAGFMKENPLKDFDPEDFSKENYEKFDPHKPYVDEIVLVSDSGKPMYREPDLIDVWFDSGAMPYAQLHYPFENKEKFKKNFPGDFISEGVDQTRGWFFTLHAIAVMLFDSVAVRNILSHGLLLDEKGEKMAKRKGNVIDPFQIFGQKGSDAVRWYLMTNTVPWDNIKFSVKQVDEIIRKFFGTLYNTYSFFALYANVDGFRYEEEKIPVSERPMFDKWIISRLNSLIKEVRENLDNYDVTKAGRAIQNFVIDEVSNWYVRLNRKRFWGGEYDKDKIAAYQTLFEVLFTVAQLMAPMAPFYAEKLFLDLNSVAKKSNAESVHLTDFPEYDESLIDKTLEERMFLAQKITSMTLALRRKAKIKVRQPLQRILIPVIYPEMEENLRAVEDIIKAEINVKEIEFIKDTRGVVTKKIKPDYKKLGKKLGKLMKNVAKALNEFSQEDIYKFEEQKIWTFDFDGQQVTINIDEVEIVSEDVQGWLTNTDGKYTVALDITITDELRQEGIARELINRVQNFRKELDFQVTDRIILNVQKHDELNKAVENFKNYIASQTLAKDIRLADKIDASANNAKEVDLQDSINTVISIEKAD